MSTERPRAGGAFEAVDESEALSDQLTALLEGVVDRLIPADPNGPGAVAAGVPRYIALSLAGDYANHVPAYRAGLRALDAHAVSAQGRGFLALGAEDRDRVLEDFERGDGGPDAQAFFELVRLHTLEGMFGDPVWGGNKDYAGWRLLGYPGPRLEWSADEQQLDAEIAPVWEHPGPPSR